VHSIYPITKKFRGEKEIEISWAKKYALISTVEIFYFAQMRTLLQQLEKLTTVLAFRVGKFFVLLYNFLGYGSLCVMNCYYKILEGQYSGLDGVHLELSIFSD